MTLYHFCPVKLEPGDGLKTASMLDDDVKKRSLEPDTLSALLAPISKTSIDRLRSAGFKSWDTTLYLYKFELKDVTCKEIRFSSNPMFDIMPFCDRDMPTSDRTQWRTKCKTLPYIFDKRQLESYYKKYKAVFEDNVPWVEKQIYVAKYHEDKEWRREVLDTYAYYIPHVLLKLTKPVTKIKHVGKF